MVKRPLSLLLLFLGCAPAPEALERRPTYVFEPGAAERQSQALTGEVVQLFLNPCPGGCTFRPGPTDARLNTSSIPTREATLPETKLNAEEWDELHRCLYKAFADFNVVLVDQEPTSGPYIEAVIAGRPQDIGADVFAAGVSPMDCGLIDRGINFSFGAVIGRAEGVEALCGVIAHETGHTMGLDHVYLCSDLMSYLEPCGEKTFTRVDAECGEREPRQCACDDGTLQNSYLGLLRSVGRRTVFVDQPPRIRLVTPRVWPGVEVLFPEVEAAFPIVVDATDLEGPVVRLEARIDGQLLGTANVPPWAFTAPDTLALGRHVVQVVGFDERGQRSTSTATVVLTERRPPWDGGFFDGAGPRPDGEGTIDAGVDPGTSGEPLPQTLSSDGCRCLGPPPSIDLRGWALAALVVLGAVRPRRRR